jgi:hypothetical protein
MTKYRIIRIEMEGKKVGLEVASDMQEAEELLKKHWKKEKANGNEPSPIQDGKFKCAGGHNEDYFYSIEEIDL